MRSYRFTWRTGLAAGVLTAAGLALRSSALPVVLDIRPTLLALSAAALVLFVLAARRAPSRPRLGAAVAAATMSGIVALLMVWDLGFVYRAEEVSFTNGAVTLRGTLYLPRGDGPHPAVVLMHGSGRQPRHEYTFYARAYARRGIAALAYDKRGSGESEGSVRTATYEELAEDAVKGVEMLRARSDIAPRRVGLWGLSEGEWTAPLAAVRIDPAFLVLVSPSAMTPSRQVQHETGANVLRAGFSAAEAWRARELYARLADFQRTGQGRDALNRALAAASGEPWFDAAENLEPRVPEYEKVRVLEWFPAWKQRMDFDALPLFARIDCPVLAQAGGDDPQNDGAQALQRIERALAAGGNTSFTGIVYPEAGHGLIEWRLPFGLPPPWFASGYLDAQLDWVERQVTSR